MKRYTPLIVLLTALLAGCQEDFLSLTDPTKVSTTNLFTTSANVTAAVNGVYSALQPVYNNDYYIFGELASDNAYESVAANGHYFFSTFAVDATNPNLQSMWTDTYKCISRANAVLDQAVAVSMDSTLKKRYFAEMKFIRAVNYFNLVRIWGDVPLVVKDLSADYQDAYDYARTPAAQVYAQIIQDLKDAETVLPATYSATDLGRPTSLSAKALLGKVYLTQKTYDLAAAKLGELIPGAPTAGSLANISGLLPNFSDVFSPANEMNKEIIFAIRFLSGGLGTGSSFASVFLPGYSGTDIIKVGISGGPTERLDLFSAYSTADKRTPISTGYYTKGNSAATSDYYTKKYIFTGPPFARNDADNDWIVLRYADVLLMYAEALNEQSSPTGALPYINQVRSRAGLPNLTGLSQAELRLAIENERRLEFSFEGQRWFDLVRTNRLIPVMNAFYAKYSAIPSTAAVPNNGLFVNSGGSVVQVQPNQILFPIPLAEIQYNPILTQNTGY
ncbi:RagB/SusD family nutrient uptake outer membrane protein (plasmid) [Spirosoma sp. SC4-14]|uniref:RagB/SusD family nutrient uptake outer membrane protein n=1 Tax=Spirosoma sp. SC4-14 TaxID=3128900 RepID=UPI0030D52063